MRRALDADDVDASNPAPDLVHAALAKAGAKPGEALFIGDTPWDVPASANSSPASMAAPSRTRLATRPEVAAVSSHPSLSSLIDP
ncbi:HAD family hydrolase [Kitasatospora sp. NPDC052896]|uniref:HAD family hydrolase n=1 Tax=Kitasatospora sp. NPDC052896 TaxID=3364061 RepID=UPI0037C55142